MEATCKEYVGSCKEGTMAGTPKEVLYNDLYNSLNDSSICTPSFNSST